MIDYNEYLERIESILKADKRVTDVANNFRIGDIGKDLVSHQGYPLIVLTTPIDPLLSREVKAPNVDINTLGTQRSELLFIIEIYFREDDSIETQREIYNMMGIIQDVLEHNIRLTGEEGNDPLSHDLTVQRAGRDVATKGGTMAVGIVGVRVVVYE